MRINPALLVGVVVGVPGGWLAHALLADGPSERSASEAANLGDGTADDGSLGAGRAGERAPITRRDVADSLKRFERRKDDAASISASGLIALATLEAVSGDDAEFLRLAERALASGMLIDDLLGALSELPVERQAALLAALLDKHPDAVSDTVAVARALTSAGRSDRALSLVRAALPRQQGFHSELARSLIELDPEGASAALLALEGSERWDADELDALRALLIGADQEARLRPFLERTLDADPSDHAALRSLRKVDAAAADVRLRALLAKNPDDPTAWSLLGEIRHDAGDAAGAFDAFKRAAERDPRRSSFRYLIDADPVRGLDVVVALTKDSADDEMLGALGEMYALAGRKDDAVNALIRANAHDPRDMEWLDRLIALRPSAALGVVEKQLGDAPGAVRDDLLGRYGDALRAAGRAPEAFQQYVAANRRNPDADSWQQALVELDARAALPILASHVKARPMDASGRGNYGVALVAAGRSSEGVAEIERALADGDPRRWYTELRKVDPARAIEGLERRARADSTNDRVWGLLGHELLAAHRKDEARAAYEHAARLAPSSRDWARALRDLR